MAHATPSPPKASMSVRPLIRTPFLTALLGVVVVAGSQAGQLDEACDDAVDCAEGLRCVDLGGDQRLCARPCTVEKRRAGYPEGLADEALFTDGGTAQASVDDPQCADAPIDVTSQDEPEAAAQKIAIRSSGVVGVCRVAPALLAHDAVAPGSVVAGLRAPL